jgi:hypothetical protein
MSETIVSEKCRSGNVTYFAKDEKLSLEKMQELVGGYIEIAYDDGDIQIVCNELGKMDFDNKVNEEATNLWYESLGHNPNDFLVGDVLVLKGKARME